MSADYYPDEFEKPSKSERKRLTTALQNLGEALLTLTPKQIAELELPRDLLKAVEEAKRISQDKAMRRQNQFIGKLMRQQDDETIERIRRCFARLGRPV